ncbi:MAG TPA: hypothetical protein VFZ19_06925, partial [Solirubrobacterales bacterium]
APQRPRQHGIAPSADPEGKTVASEPGTKAALNGRSGEYRVIFRSMRMPGFPQSIDIGGVCIAQTAGPVWTQKTDIRQSPGWRPVYHKRMRRFPVGDGEDLTVCTIPVRLGPDLRPRDLEQWHSQAHAAVGIAVAVFDERLAIEQLGEDLVILDEFGMGETAADQVVRVREYPPVNRVSPAHRRALAKLESLDLSRPAPLNAATRWYLRAAQEGPTPDAVVSLWIALEALSKPPYGTKLSSALRRRSDVEWVEHAVREAGGDPNVDPTIGRLAGLRAQIVHGGIEQPKLLREGFYTLEASARLLIRHQLEIGVGWQLCPNRANLKEPLQSLAAYLQNRFRATRWLSSS